VVNFRPPHRRRPGCGTLISCLGAVVLGVWIVVHAVTAWSSGHPAVPAAVVVLMLLSGWGGPELDLYGRRP
jgi:hypothetical protein